MITETNTAPVLPIEVSYTATAHHSNTGAGEDCCQLQLTCYADENISFECEACYEVLYDVTEPEEEENTDGTDTDEDDEDEMDCYTNGAEYNALKSYLATCSQPGTILARQMEHGRIEFYDAVSGTALFFTSPATTW